MSLYELLDVLAENAAQINVLWNFFIWIHLAVLGGLILLPRRVNFIERVVVLLAYGAFAWVNRGGLIDAYSYKEVLLAEIARQPVDVNVTGGLIVRHLSAFAQRPRLVWFEYVHPLAGGLVTIAILSVNRFFVATDRAASKPAPASAA